MRLKKRLTIIPDTVPDTNEDICQGVAEYCAEFSLPYEFLDRSYPVVAILNGTKYQITKRLTRRFCFNLWILCCKEID